MVHVMYNQRLEKTFSAEVACKFSNGRKIVPRQTVGLQIKHTLIKIQGIQFKLQHG